MREPIHPVVVIKIGGSVLTDGAAYRRAARFLANRLCDRPDERLLAVVSAEHGLTDQLLASARDFAPDPDAEALDLLWSTGELRSVALLVLALQAQGVHARGANVHQSGLGDEAGPRAGAARPTRVRTLRLRALLARAPIVVVPGFLARTPGDGIASLGRGGSDLSAVLFAAALGARSCELLKDVPGYFTADPHVSADAEHLDALDYDTAVAMAAAGCPLVQDRALAVARDFAVPLVVRTFDDRRSTRVDQLPRNIRRSIAHGVRDENHPRRPAGRIGHRSAGRTNLPDLDLRAERSRCTSGF